MKIYFVQKISGKHLVYGFTEMIEFIVYIKKLLGKNCLLHNLELFLGITEHNAGIIITPTHVSNTWRPSNKQQHTVATYIVIPSSSCSAR